LRGFPPFLFLAQKRPPMNSPSPGDAPDTQLSRGAAVVHFLSWYSTQFALKKCAEPPRFFLLFPPKPIREICPRTSPLFPTLAGCLSSTSSKGFSRKTAARRQPDPPPLFPPDATRARCTAFPQTPIHSIPLPPLRQCLPRAMVFLPPSAKFSTDRENNTKLDKRHVSRLGPYFPSLS